MVNYPEFPWLKSYSDYQCVQGYPPLRQAIATHIGMTRGVHCSPEQIILCPAGCRVWPAHAPHLTRD